MQVFSNENKQELILLLKTLPIHDSCYKNITYDKVNKKCFVSAYNPIRKLHINFTFENVSLLVSTDFDLWGKNETILAFVLEKDTSLIQSLLQPAKTSCEKKLYFVFESFSGNQIHIVCEKMSWTKKQPT